VKEGKGSGGTGAAQAARARRTLAVRATAGALALVMVVMMIAAGVIMGVVAIIIVIQGLRHDRRGQAGRFIGEGQQRVALGAGELSPALFPHKECDETAGEQETEEYCDRYDGHAWNVFNRVSSISLRPTAHALP
jgi:hypothetical protein